jgi:beta-N-acetylhexosaminidase
VSVRTVALLLAAGVALTACSSARRPVAGPTTSTDAPVTNSTTTTQALTSTSSVPSTSSTSAPPGACLDRAAVATWSLSRRATELIAVPALSADPAVVQAAVSEGAGGILLLGPMPGAAQLAADLHSDVAARSARSGRVPLVMVDQEGGGVQRLGADVASLPWPREMAATMTPAQVQQRVEAVGRQMAALGVNVDLAPVLDLDGGRSLSASDPDGPRSFSTDPVLAASYGAAFVAGLRAAGVLPVVKHFPGLGQSSGNTDYGPASTRPYSDLQTAGLVPFERTISAGAPGVMVANATVPGLTSKPASVSAAVINGLLRGQLHFGGLVTTDSLSAGAISQAGYDVSSAAVASIEAGADLVLFGSTLTAADTRMLAPAAVQQQTRSMVAAIAGAAQTGRLPAARLNQAVLDVARAEGAPVC